jgi:hypothetical protein
MSVGRKKVLVFIISGALLLGAAAAVFFHRFNATDPVVETDINEHFKNVMNGRPDNDGENISEETDVGDQTVQPSGRKLKTNAKASSKQKPRNSRTPPASKRSGTSYAGIECVSEGTCLIDRALFSDAAKNPGNYVGNTTASVIRNGDNLEGFRLNNISGGCLSALGLRDDDTLLAINGFPLTNTSNVSRAMAAALGSTQFRLDIRRSGKAISLYYRLK